MTRPLALDLFCKAGGASMGLHRAGFDVVGVDIEPQPRYPFHFIQADALSPPLDLCRFDFIWASPPCEAFTLARNMKSAKDYPNLIPQTREMLSTARTLTCIENVPRAPLRCDLMLDGWMFPELKVIRERHFELSFFALAPQRSRPSNLLHKGYLSVIGCGTPPYMVARGIRYLADDCRAAMGIEWMTRRELSKAVPPPYAEFIGRAAMKHLTA